MTATLNPIKEGARYVISTCQLCGWEDHEELTALVTPYLAKMQLNRRFLLHCVREHPVERRAPPPPDPGEIERSLENMAAVERADESRPQWDDYVREGVIDTVPEPDADGNIDVVVSDPEKAKRAFEMTEEAALKEAEHFEKRHGERERVEMKFPNGVVKQVTEKNEDLAGRKKGARRTRRWGRRRRIELG